MPHDHATDQEAAEAARAAATRAEESGGAAPALAATLAGPRPSTRAVSPAQAVALQRSAGNRATSALLGATKPVQRIWPEDVDTEAVPGGAATTTAPKAPGVTTAPPAGSTGGGGGTGSAPATGSQSAPTPTTAPPATPPSMSKPAGGSKAPGSAPAAKDTGAPPGGAPSAPTPQDLAPPPIVRPPVPQPTHTPGEPPDPELARSGITWDDVNLANVTKYGRPAMEMARVIPGWGLIAGMGSDIIGLENDLRAVPPGDYPITKDLIIARDLVATVNNGLGHLLYVNQLLQDGLIGSVIFAEVTPLTAEINELLSTIKIGMDGALMWGDIGIMVGARYNQTHTSDKTQAEAWQGVFDGAAANLLGDAVGTILDTISLASLGAANTEPGKEAAVFFTSALKIARMFKPVITSWVQSVWNLWGSDAAGAGHKAVEPNVAMAPAAPAAPAGPAQRIEAPGGGSSLLAGAYDAAATILEGEAQGGRAAYAVVDQGIGEMEAAAAEQMAKIDALCAELTGGKTLWQVVQDGALRGIGAMRDEVASLRELEAGATDAQANTAQVHETVATAMAKVDALQMPNVQVPKTELGDGVLADAAESLLNAGASVANSGLQLVVDQARGALDTGKSAIKAPLQSLDDKAGEVGEFMATAAQVAGEQTGIIEAKIASFEAKISQCGGFEDALDALAAGFAEMTGMPQVTVQDLRDAWADVPGLFDRVDALAATLHQRAAAAQGSGGGGGDTGGPSMAPPIGGGGESGGGGSTDDW